MTWVAAGIASASLTVGAAQYIGGKVKQNKLEKNRSQYEIPSEIAQNLSQAQVMALEGMPEESRQIAISGLKQSYSTGLSQIGTRKGGLAGVSDLYQGVNQGYQQLAAQDAAQRVANQRNLMGQRQVMADYRDQKFQFNEVNPYYEKTAESQALMGAGMQNVSQGFQALGGAAGGFPKKSAPVNNPNTGAGYKKYPAAYNSFQLDDNTENVGGSFMNPTPMLGGGQGYQNPYGQGGGSYLNPNGNIFNRE